MYYGLNIFLQISYKLRKLYIVVDREVLENLYHNIKEDLMKVVSEGKESIFIPYERTALVSLELAEKLLDYPEETLYEIQQFIKEKLDIPHEIKVRVYNLPKSRFIRIRDIRSFHLGKLIEIEGVIKVSTEVRPVITEVLYEHTECGYEFWYKMQDFKMEKPKLCPRCKQPAGRFIEKDKKIIDVQRLLVEEPPEQIEKGEQPAQIMVFLKEDLCEPKMERKTIPGTRIRLVGIVKTLQSKKTGSIMDIYLDAIYIEPLDKDIEDIEITEDYIRKIKELARSTDVISILSQSIAPSIYGKQYEHIKKALLLQLVGASARKRPDGTKTRGNIHILLIGDPGTGKSQLLQFIHKIAPKSRFVSGTTASAVGLTANVRRDEFLKGGWALEAGALVLASGGIVCIDELDKIDKSEMLALHEAMEQGTVTVHKANIHATLRSDASVLAAANPKFGRWDEMRSIVEQINLPDTILNRFDLIFVLRDIPDEKTDYIIAEGVLFGLTEPKEGIIPYDLLRRYIIYAKTIEPTWTEAAKDVVKEFYISIRSAYKNQQTIPITARQLEAIIRLSEASARVRLSNKVTKEDVELAKLLLMKSLEEVGFNPETKTIDVDIIATGKPATEWQRRKQILDTIKRLSRNFPDGVPLEEIINELKEKGHSEDRIKKSIESLIKDGSIFEPKRNHYKVVE